MKCLAAFRSTSDIIFFDCDPELAQYLRSKLGTALPFEDLDESYSHVTSDTTVHVKEGEVEENSNELPDLTLIYHFFNYFIIIQSLQSSEDNDIRTIVTEDGLCVAFHLFDGVNVMVIDRADTYTVYQRCLIFEKLTRFHLGPASLFLKPSDRKFRERLWTKLKYYLMRWEDVVGMSSEYATTVGLGAFEQLYEHTFKPHFLFQSNEHLHVNATLKSDAVKLLKTAMEMAATTGDVKYSQGLLVVEGKVFVSYQSSSQEPLEPCDLLFILFLCHTNREEHNQQIIFLNRAQHDQHYLPCTMTSVPIMEGIVLLLLGEINTSLAPNICGAINTLLPIEETLTDIEKRYNVSGTLRVTLNMEEFGKSSKVINFFLNRMRKDIKRAELDREWRQLHGEWNAAEEGCRSITSGNPDEFFAFFDHVTKLIDGLRRLFYMIYCSDEPVALPANLDEIVGNLRRGLRDSASYLLVKAQRNFIIGNYIVQFPGLVHFLFINRAENRVLVPCFGGQGSSARYCFTMVTTLHRFYRRLLEQGVVQGYMRKRDLMYTYRIWFRETDSGQLVKPNVGQGEDFGEVYRAGRMVCSMFRDLVSAYFPRNKRRCIECYELLTIHVGDLPVEYVSESNRRLFSSLKREMDEN